MPNLPKAHKQSWPSSMPDTEGATVTRCEARGWEPDHFPVYGPKAFAAIGRLPDTLADRCICIPMQRKSASQTVARFLFARTPAEAEPIRNNRGVVGIKP